VGSLLSPGSGMIHGGKGRRRPWLGPPPVVRPRRSLPLRLRGAPLRAPLEPHALAPDTEAIDYCRLVEEAGLQVEICEEPPKWRTQQRRLAEGIVAAESEVTQEMGAHYSAMARGFLKNLSKVRYLLVVARRPPETPRGTGRAPRLRRP